MDNVSLSNSEEGGENNFDDVGVPSLALTVIASLSCPSPRCEWSMVLTTHTDPKIWGSDSYEFNPDRFANGITSACKLPHMYMPFGVGPRVCLGQKLAMVELKILLAFMVSNFSITLSPKYIHSPAMRLVIEPKHGVNRLVKKL
ncbi:hypothetical protein TEA_008821 [Camellia sinensis var. sinensis]|uniref:Cytochrome P450 n=1 Tax=Camellia sinensis var. sinensis TaxID=542762 RepID=A0A4S4DP34_CAMSN|nr:hypothetical protein TEA_008821 [Camellia sinensis var. sinensis]